MKLEMRHTEESIRRLARVQYNTYCMGQKLITALFAAALVVLGMLGFFGQVTSLVLVAIGCWTFTGINAPADRNAKKMIECAKGRLPSSAYTFGADAVIIEGDGQQETLRYKDIYSLIWDGPYLYLFISRYSAYMIPMETMPEKDAEELRELLRKRTGLALERPGSMLSFNRKALKRSFAAGQRESDDPADKTR